MGVKEEGATLSPARKGIYSPSIWLCATERVVLVWVLLRASTRHAVNFDVANMTGFEGREEVDCMLLCCKVIT